MHPIRFWYVVFIFALLKVISNFLSDFFIDPSVIHKCVVLLISMCLWVPQFFFFYWVVLSIIPLWSENIICMISVLLKLLRLVLQPIMFSQHMLWCWRRLLRVPWTARRSNWSTLKEINTLNVHRRTNAVAEAPTLWPPDAKSWLTGEDSEAGKDWGQEEKQVTEDEMSGWLRRLNGLEFEQTPGDSEGQGSLVCWNPWGHKGSDMT